MYQTKQKTAVANRQRVVKDAVACAGNDIPERPQCDCGSRPKVVRVRPIERFRRSLQLTRGLIEVRNEVVWFTKRRLVVVPQSKIDGQPRVRTPVVLDVKAGGPSPKASCCISREP